jgi:Ca2+-transporting ATPase
MHVKKALEYAHALSVEEVLRELCSKEEGLSASEAAKRLLEFGYNELREAPKRKVFAMFFSQFASFMILVLVAAAVIAALLGRWIDAGAIATILMLNAMLGTVQECRAEKAIEALRKMVIPTARVMREGKDLRIPAREIVPGDVVVVEAGDRIPADARLLESVLFETNEAPLTGESTPVKKEAGKILPENTVLNARFNMIFTGTTVTNGRARGIVTAIGMQTELGRIASAVQEIGVEETPLKQNLEKFGKQLAIIVVIGALALFFFGIQKGIPSLQMFLTSVSLAVAVIPEGLPAVMTIALALGVKRMSGRNAIIRRLLAVETLGSTNVILTDKTGTLTKNEMTVRQIYTSKFYEATGVGYESHGVFLESGKSISPIEQPELKVLLYISALCNNASLVYDEGNKTWIPLGDPTEAALLALAHKAGIHRHDLKRRMHFIGEFPFDSVRMRMTVVYGKNGEKLALTKGAPESVLQCCTQISTNGREHLLTQEDRANILEAQRLMGENAMRVLAFAQRRLGLEQLSPENIERNLTFIGLVGIIDAPREEIPAAIDLCRQAGITVVMVTGDNEMTARAIAREIGLLSEGDLVVTGQELEEIKDKELMEKVDRIRVYARVAPEHKLRIVQAWKAKGKIVAVTGDGINDAPALKQADIGIAMGITGTDVAKEVSQMVLADDNFASIVSAVEEGRGIYENIRKCIFFIFPANIAEVLVVFLGILLGFPLPLTAIQILWVNLITETIPAFALAVDPIDKEVMTRPPRPRNESFWKGGRVFLVEYSIILAVSALGLFAITYKSDIMKAQTMAFTMIVVSGVFRAFNCRSLVNPVRGKLFENKWLVFTVLLIFLLQFAVVSLPFFGVVLSVKPLTLLEWAWILGVGAAGFVYLEIYKAFASSRLKNNFSAGSSEGSG